jgi:hypothetical protein
MIVVHMIDFDLRTASLKAAAEMDRGQQKGGLQVRL